MIEALALIPHDLKLQNLQSAAKVQQSGMISPFLLHLDWKKDTDEIADNIWKQVTRDVYTCMRAKCGDEKISSNDFITVPKKVCKWIPQLKDKKAVGLKVDCSDFAYWVSATNTASSYYFMIENYLVIVKVIHHD